MTAKELGEQAAMPAQSFGQDGLPECPLIPGLTKRELFAALALPGLLANDVVLTMDQSACAAVRAADALLAELAKGEQ